MKVSSIKLLCLFSLCFFPATTPFSEPNDLNLRGCKQVEHKALVEFKNMLRNASNFLSSWTGENCCAWKGISCNNETGHVTKISLRNVDCHTSVGNSSCLGGEISPSLLKLKYLSHLDLSLNDFQTPIPEFFGSFEFLSYLDLSFASFNGMVPRHLGNLSNLRYLDLGSSFDLWVSDFFWVSRITSLEYLSMSNVNLSLVSPHWPQALNFLPSLSHLYLGSCNLQSLPKLPSRVNFTFLSVLDLSLNSFDLSIPRWFSNLSSLVSLDISFSKIKGDISEQLLGNLPNISLEKLVLWENHINGQLPNSLALFKKLRFLYVSDNSISGSIPECVGNLTNLEQLALAYNQMNGSIPDSIKMLTQLQGLHLLNNHWQGILSQDHLQGFKKLESISVSSSDQSFKFDVSPSWVPPFSLADIEIRNCNLGPKFPAWLRTQKDISNIKLAGVGISQPLPDWLWTFSSRANWYDFSNNQITGTLFPLRPISSDIPYLNSSNVSYPSWHNISFLNLAGNALSGPIPANIGEEMPFAFALNLSGNLFNGPIPASIAKMMKLTLLDLSSNRFSGKIQNHMWDTQELLYLDLSGNNLSGTIPASILSLPRLLYLKLNSNKFYGDLSSLKVPDTIMYLSSLDLGGNKFSGMIPKWMFEKSLILSELRLRNNMFSGNIPEELCDLTYLHLLDVGFNNLSGPIPNCLGNLISLRYSFVTYIPSSSATVIDFFKPPPIELVWKGRQMLISEIVKLVNLIALSSNNLTGEIPKEIAKLSGLGTLNLSRNHLKGHIPWELGQLGQIETLDLSHNLLSGPIPQSMTSMTSLNHLNLSYNNLSGKIPLANQFLTLNDPSIYEGNTQLCGFPLPYDCLAPENRNGEDQGQATDIDDEEETGKFGFYVSMGLGFVFGFWAVYGSMAMCKKLRYAYFHYVDILCNWIAATFA